MNENFPETIASLTKRLEMLQDKHESLDFWAAKTVAKMLSELDTSVSALRKDGGETYTDLTRRVDNHIAAISESIERIEQRLDGHGSRLDAHVSLRRSLEQEITEHAKRLNGHDQRLDDQTELRRGIEQRLDGLAQTIAEVVTDAESLAERLDALETAYQGHVKRLHEARESHIQTWDPDDLFVRRIDLDAHGREGWGSRYGGWEIRPVGVRIYQWAVFRNEQFLKFCSTLEGAAKYVKDNSLVWEANPTMNHGERKAWKAENINIIPSVEPTEFYIMDENKSYHAEYFKYTPESLVKAWHYAQTLTKKYVPEIPND